MKALVFAGLAFLPLLCACESTRRPAPGTAAAAGKTVSAPAPAETAEAPILIRLRNTSDTLEMRAAYAIFPEDTVLFGDIPARGYTEYRPVRKSYRYAYVRVQAGGREWIMQPVDFVGEKLLEPGRYTWEIRPHDGPYPGFLDFEALEDKAHP